MTCQMEFGNLKPFVNKKGVSVSADLSDECMRKAWGDRKILLTFNKWCEPNYWSAFPQLRLLFTLDFMKKDPGFRVNIVD